MKPNGRRAASVLVVCGLSAEARIARGPGIRTIAGGGSSAGLAETLAACDPTGLLAVVSFGVAGALDPTLRPGDVLLPRAILGRQDFSCDEALRAGWVAALTGCIAHTDGTIVGVDAPVLTPNAKAALRARTGAGAVDMESHLAADYARRHGLPFGAVRVISDAADHVLPAVAAAAMRPNGAIAIGAVIAGLLRRPGQLPALLTTARDAGRAFSALRAGRVALGPDYGVENLPGSTASF